MPTHPQQPRNPWEQDSPTNADYMQMIRELNTRDGQNPEEAEFNAVQEMQHYMKNDINPMGPISGREATYNEIEGSRGAHQAMQEQEESFIQQQQQRLKQDFNTWLMNQGNTGNTPPSPQLNNNN